MAMWPPFRRGCLGFACFLLAMAVSEVPLVFLVVIAASILLQTLSSPTDTLAWLSYPLFTFVLFGLVWLQVRARTARRMLERALAEGLGQDWHATITPALRRRPRTSTPWVAGILRPFQRHRRDVLRLRNQSYGPHGRANLLDIYRGCDDSTGRPILIHLHGGGFIQGNKSREGVTLLNQLAADGWLCVSANYRLGTAAAHPHPLVDTKRVIAWVRAHAVEYGADPGQVFMVGSSAGAYLAAMAALTANDPGLQPGFEDAETSVSAVVSLYGYLGPRTADSASSPTAQINAGAPPFLVVEGGNDTSGLPQGLARTFADGLRRVSDSPVIHAVLPGAQHDFDFFASVRARVVADEIESFLDWIRTRNQ